MKVRMAKAHALIGALTTAMTFFAPFGAASNSAAAEQTASSASMDRAAIENLQRWVNSGHESWCKDSRLIAASELHRALPELDGEDAQWQMLELDAESSTAAKATFTWTNFDGSASYRVTVERFAWLVPIAGRVDDVIWVPTQIVRITRP